MLTKNIKFKNYNVRSNISKVKREFKKLPSLKFLIPIKIYMNSWMLRTQMKSFYFFMALLK